MTLYTCILNNTPYDVEAKSLEDAAIACSEMYGNNDLSDWDYVTVHSPHYNDTSSTIFKVTFVEERKYSTEEL